MKKLWEDYESVGGSKWHLIFGAIFFYVFTGICLFGDDAKPNEKRGQPPTIDELAKAAYISHCLEVDPQFAWREFEKTSSDVRILWKTVARDISRIIAERGMPVEIQPQIKAGEIYWRKWGEGTLQVEVVSGPDRGKYLVRRVEFNESFNRPVDVRNPDAPRTKTIRKGYGLQSIVSADELMFGPCEDKSTER